VRVVLKFVAVGALLLSCSDSGRSVSNALETGKSEVGSLSTKPLKVEPPEAPTTTLSVAASSSSNPTQTTAANVAKQFALCASIDEPTSSDQEPPAGSLTRRCRTSSGKATFYFVAYPGTEPHLFEDVVVSVFAAAELFPLFWLRCGTGSGLNITR